MPIIPRPGGFSGTLALAKTLRGNRYDLVISLARSEEAFLLLGMSGAVKKAGFRRFPLDLLLDVRETVEGHNSWHNNARLLRRLGIEPTADTYVGLLPVRPEELAVAVSEPYVVISAGASPRRLIKAWDEDKFASLILSLHDRYGLRPVLVGAKDTVESNEFIGQEVRKNDAGRGIEVLDLTGRLNLRALTALLMKARLFVGIDSGVMHLASAVDIPVVGLFGPTDPVYVAPQTGRCRRAPGHALHALLPEKDLQGHRLHEVAGGGEGHGCVHQAHGAGMTGMTQAHALRALLT
jgi:heptosyltransferase-3